MRSEFDEKSAAQNATRTHGKVHDALMQQKRNGNIPGIIGKVLYFIKYHFYPVLWNRNLNRNRNFLPLLNRNRNRNLSKSWNR